METNGKEKKKYYEKKICNNIIKYNLNNRNTKINFQKQKQIIMNKLNILLISILILIIVPISTAKAIKVRSLIFTNEIILVINGTGDLTIIYNDALIPDQIYINNGENSLSGAKVIYNIETFPTTVRLIYESQLTSCFEMFLGLRNILYINFNNFDFSKVTDMSSMFHSCNSLTSIDFTGINTSSLNNLNYAFFQCESLNNLDLRSFNTTSVTTMSQTFFGCYDILSIDLSSFDTSSVITMFQLFFQCYNLQSLDLSNFNTSLVTSMFQMFYQNYNLLNLNISNFNTKSVTTMQEMFSSCVNLQSLDFSNFDTSSVNNVYRMFFECKSLNTLNLSSFNTENINNMAEMFNLCENLEIIDLSSFNTSNTEHMGNLFTGCKNLISLNLSNFNTSRVQYMDNMFNGCINLEILDISHFNTSNVLNMANMFLNCQNIKSLDLSHFDTLKVNNMANMFSNCSLLTSLELGNFNTSLVTDMSKMFYYCKSLISLNLNSFNTDNVITFDEMFISLNNSLKYCINENIKNEIISQFSSSNLKVNCSELCFDNSQKKYIPEKNICMNNCFNDDIYIYEYNNKCYEYPFEEEELGTSSNNIDFQNPENNKYTNYSSISSNDINYMNKNDLIGILNNINNNNISINENEKDNMLIKIRYAFINGKFNDIISNLIEGEKNDILISDNNIIYQFTSTYNQNNDYINNNNNYYYKNISNIKLGECETKLKNHYEINENDSLLIFKYDIFVKGFLIPITEYEIYDSKTKKNLDLNICQNMKIIISHYVNIDEKNIIKHDPTNDYYNDICYPHSTENKTDIILKDRQKEYINNNLSLCEANCEYERYNIETKNVECNCLIKIEFPLISEIVINKNLLLNNFVNIENYINLNIMKCYSILFSKEGIINNIGNYIIASIIIINIFTLIAFLLKGYRLLNNKIDSLIKIKTETNSTNNIENINEINENNKSKINIIEQIKNEINKIFLKNKYNNEIE